MVSGGRFLSPGSRPPTFLRGLTFDLDTDTMTHVAPCPDSGRGYGAGFGEPDNYRFRYGDLLDLCDPAAYRRFVALVREIDDARPVRHLARSENDRRKGCWLEDPIVPLGVV
jgi:hypothetical protein